MGKGDKRTKKGKRTIKSYGVTRPRTKKSTVRNTNKKRVAKKTVKSTPKVAKPKVGTKPKTTVLSKKVVKPSAKDQAKIEVKPQVESKAKVVTKPMVESKTKVSTQTKAKSTPAKKSTGATNELTKIEGIGPKLSEVISSAGITSFSDLANATPSKLKTILADAGNRYKAFDPTTWPEQAKLAADGKWEELEKLQSSLHGGKKK